MFQNRYLAVIAYANGATIWHYRDLKIKSAEVNLNNFFNPINRLCAVGDKIIVVLNDTYMEVVVVKIHNQNVICRELTSLQYNLDESQEEE